MKTAQASGRLKCPLKPCTYLADDETDLLDHLTEDHNLPGDMAVKLAIDGDMLNA